MWKKSDKLQVWSMNALEQKLISEKDRLEILATVEKLNKLPRTIHNQYNSSKYHTTLDPNTFLKNLKFDFDITANNNDDDNDFCDETKHISPNKMCPYYQIHHSSCPENLKTCHYRWKSSTIQWSNGCFRFGSNIYDFTRAEFPFLYEISEKILTLAKPCLEKINMMMWPEDLQTHQTHRILRDAYNDEQIEKFPIFQDENFYKIMCDRPAYEHNINDFENFQDYISQNSLENEIESFKEEWKLNCNINYHKNPIRITENSKLQVVTKIQAVKIGSGINDGYEGVYHTDGGIHQRVLAVVLFYYKVPETLLGGDMEFVSKKTDEIQWAKSDLMKRSFNTRPSENVAIRQGQLLVFSNQEMIHKVCKMTSSISSTDQLDERGFLAYFIIDPRFKSPSTERFCILTQFFKRKNIKINKDLCNIILEYLNDFISLQLSSEMRQNIFRDQMKPDAMKIYTNGNGDCHEIVHESLVPIYKKGTTISKNSDFDKMSDNDDGKFWI